MRITENILSIPPYISTKWENITTLYIEDNSLMVALKTGINIKVPGLSESELSDIFEAHLQFEEKNSTLPISAPQIPEGALANMELPIMQLDLTKGALEHNPELSDAPPLPQEILHKLTNVSKALGFDFSQIEMPPCEPHCNCPYCQIARAISGTPDEEKTEEEIVLDEEISFREWDIEKIEDKLYAVKHPLDPKETYQVFLGSPVGCTCGNTDCEHIKAVLRS